MWKIEATIRLVDLDMGLQVRKINWVYDADIQGFFNAIDHEWQVKFIEHRIGDRRVIRHVKKWLKAGVLEDDEWRETDEGTPQGGSVSPLLANIYLQLCLGPVGPVVEEEACAGRHDHRALCR